MDWRSVDVVELLLGTETRADGCRSAVERALSCDDDTVPSVVRRMTLGFLQLCVVGVAGVGIDKCGGGYFSTSVSMVLLPLFLQVLKLNDS